ncbi:MAG TPA: glycoside hydrolase family 130 protein [Mobilitalea sp.]|nr:glycoside hydrolase family 130 protein [Mobilitalea sp.]
MIIGGNLPNMPWQERPEGCRDVVWRYSNNPIIGRHQIPSANSIFNSAVIAKDGAFVGIFRSDDKAMQQRLFLGKSENGIDWDIEQDPMPLYNQKDECVGVASGYDPRVCLMDDRYVVTWCNNYHGPTIGVAYSYDFKKFYQMENAFLPFNRNGVMFPRKINGKYMMFSRPSDNGHTPFGDMYLSQSYDLEHWGYHRFVMEAKGWAWTKVGAGPIPIETEEGWLLIFHGVGTTCNGMIYSMGAALLDIDEPWKVKYRCKPFIFHPEELYECVGDVPNVTFPCATLQDAATGRIVIYYGAADTVVAMAFTQVDELITYIKDNAL